ncbi:putative reverse transcriptase domain-containing protein [Tanacetum coccineum]
MKTEAMSLTMLRRMTASIQRTSSTKLCSSSRALRTFTEQSHNEVHGCLKGGSGKGGRKEIMTNFDEFSILRSMDNVRSSLCMRNGPLKGHQPLNNPPWLSRHQELKFADSVANSSGSKSCTMQMIENTNRNTGEREAPVARKSYAVTPTENNGYIGNRPLCKKCALHDTGPCTVKCNTCNKVGHLTKNCKNKGPATGSNLLLVTITCHACGEKGHYANQCQKTTNNNAQGRAYMLRDMESTHKTRT